jgi:hypothetical protein
VYATTRKALIAHFALAAFAVTVAASRARAETPIAPALPFTNSELEQALLARLLTPRDEPGPPPAQVEPAGPGAVRVQVGSRTRVVVLGYRTGADAARVVALVIAELMSALPEASAAVGAPPVAARVPVAVPAVATPLRAVMRRPPAAPRLCLTGGVAKGTGSQELLAGTLDADVALPILRGRFRLVPSVGLVLMPTRNPGTFDEVSFYAAVGRLLGGASVGPIDIFAGPFVSAYTIGGATPHEGWLFGGEAMARVAAPLSTRLSLVAAARVDGYANRVRVHWADGRAYATPRVGIAIDVGLAWSWMS